MGMVSRYAVVKDGKVENVILADETFKMPGYELIKLGEEAVSPGDTWDGKQFVPAPLPEPELEAPSVEQRISDLEEALALLHMEVVKLDTASTA